MAQKFWDHYPTDMELAELMVNPETGQDQWGHTDYQPIQWAKGTRITAICSCCEKDFMEGGWYNYAPQGRDQFRLLICPDHIMIAGLVEERDEEEALALS